jgi:hypothetical protein
VENSWVRIVLLIKHNEIASAGERAFSKQGKGERPQNQNFNSLLNVPAAETRI